VFQAYRCAFAAEVSARAASPQPSQLAAFKKLNALLEETR